MLALIVEHAGQDPAQSRAHAILTRAGFAPFDYDPFTRELARAPGPNSGNCLYVADEGRVRGRVRSAPRRRVLGVEL
jgi:hypothetical protein